MGDQPSRPDPDDCPHCDDGTLTAELEADLSVLGSRREPTLKHVTECDTCEARRVLRVALDALDDADVRTVEGGYWDRGDFGSLEDYE